MISLLNKIWHLLAALPLDNLIDRLLIDGFAGEETLTKNVSEDEIVLLLNTVKIVVVSSQPILVEVEPPAEV